MKLTISVTLTFSTEMLLQSESTRSNWFSCTHQLRRRFNLAPGVLSELPHIRDKQLRFYLFLNLTKSKNGTKNRKISSNKRNVRVRLLSNSLRRGGFANQLLVEYKCNIYFKKLSSFVCLSSQGFMHLNDQRNR